MFNDNQKEILIYNFWNTILSAFNHGLKRNRHEVIDIITDHFIKTEFFENNTDQLKHIRHIIKRKAEEWKAGKDTSEDWEEKQKEILIPRLIKIKLVRLERKIRHVIDVLVEWEKKPNGEFGMEIE